MNTILVGQVRQIAADVFDERVEHITLHASPQTLQSWDSLAHLNLVLALEEHFHLEILPEESEQMTSIEAIVTLLDRRIDQARFN